MYFPEIAMDVVPVMLPAVADRPSMKRETGEL